jgi:hypothetical protein
MKKNCVICDAEFKDNWNLKRHIKRMHTPIECKCCGKHFTKHESNTKYLCNICQSRRGRIREERKCHCCEKTFTVSANALKKYCSKECKVIYDSSKKIKCKHCGYVGKDKHDLNRHFQRMHHVKKCRNCGNDYTKFESKTKGDFCSKKCREENKVKWGLIPRNRLSQRIRGLMRQYLSNQKMLKSSNTFKMLGYTPCELKIHFESQFTDGMSWENMSEWHIDHIRPVASFDFDSTEHPDFKKCWALNNLQPLWAEDNLRKSDKWDGVVNA